MNRNVIRIGLAVIAIFYVVCGGLWATNYFPLHKLYKMNEVSSSYLSKYGVDRARMPEYQAADAYQTRYALSHPDIFVTEAKIARYQSILLWGTVALCAGGVVLFLTRGKSGG